MVSSRDEWAFLYALEAPHADLLAFPGRYARWHSAIWSVVLANRALRNQ